MGKISLKAILFTIPVKDIKTEKERGAFYRTLYAVAYRYHELWILSSYANDAVIQKLMEHINSIPGASAKIVEISVDAEDLIHYLERRLAELQSKAVNTRFTYIKDQLNLIQKELEKLKSIISTQSN